MAEVIYVMSCARHSPPSRRDGHITKEILATGSVEIFVAARFMQSPAGLASALAAEPSSKRQRDIVRSHLKGSRSYRQTLLTKDDIADCFQQVGRSLVRCAPYDTLKDAEEKVQSLTFTGRGMPRFAPREVARDMAAVGLVLDPHSLGDPGQNSLKGLGLECRRRGSKVTVEKLAAEVGDNAIDTTTQLCEYEKCIRHYNCGIPECMTFHLADLKWQP